MHKMPETEPIACNEPAIQLVTRLMAEFFKVLSNPRRILILEELRNGERDVASLTDSLQVSQSTISQQIAVLRTHKLIEERRTGRTTLYSLRNPELAAWIGDGLKFVVQESKDAEGVLSAIAHAKLLWQFPSSTAEDAELADIEGVKR